MHTLEEVKAAAHKLIETRADSTNVMHLGEAPSYAYTWDGVASACIAGAIVKILDPDLFKTLQGRQQVWDSRLPDEFQADVMIDVLAHFEPRANAYLRKCQISADSNHKWGDCVSTADESIL